MRSLEGTNDRPTIIQRNSPMPTTQYTALAGTRMWECCHCKFVAMPVERDPRCLGFECGHERCFSCHVFNPRYKESRLNLFNESGMRREGRWWVGGRRGRPRAAEPARQDVKVEAMSREENDNQYLA